MYLERVLIEAKDLLNGVSIIQPMDATDVEYFHLELDSHDIIVAEGALSESFVDDDSRMMFQNAHEYAQLYPAEVAKAAVYCARRVEDGEELERVRAAIGRLIEGVSGEVSQPEPLQGFVDRIGGGLVEGWAMRPSQPDALNQVDVYLGDELIGSALAEKYREDLVAAGVRHGCHRFTFQLPHGVDPSRVQVRCDRTGTVLAHAAGVCLIGPLAA
jgi:O-antigen biosynthesis protein